jgi:hypothetical protein
MTPTKLPAPPPRGKGFTLSPQPAEALDEIDHSYRRRSTRWATKSSTRPCAVTRATEFEAEETRSRKLLISCATGIEPTIPTGPQTVLGCITGGKSVAPVEDG